MRLNYSRPVNLCLNADGRSNLVNSTARKSFINRNIQDECQNEEEKEAFVSQQRQKDKLFETYKYGSSDMVDQKNLNS